MDWPKFFKENYYITNREPDDILCRFSLLGRLFDKDCLKLASISIKNKQNSTDIVYYCDSCWQGKLGDTTDYKKID